ncbi:redoxin domain-containing protein [Spirosoma sp. HMF4905]|uniref:Redoxin domain-containing protein n=1 Tax=Spirosoma arboris TaxID=2682092 RepID=A0A7K1SR08_9BACT|nr:TlpA disulfide reductase family protein [Spirosoma arboris]MVM36244.1 redoxin domain-containing protein [Spirosoma arboris]
MVKRGLYYLIIYIWLPYNLQAQNNTLKQCLIDQAKAIQAVATTKSTTPGVFIQPLDAAYQKYQQIHHDWEECVKGHQMPLSTFKTLNGESYDSSTLAGKVLVINFWYMGCVPCVAEMPALNRLVEEYKGKGVLFLGFSSDKAEQLKPAFFQQHPFNFKIIPDARDIGKSFYFFGNPTTYIIDQHGIIRNAWVGGAGLDKLGPYTRAKKAIDNLLTTSHK